MCGITGYFQTDFPLRVLRVATESLKKRGPDEEGYFIDAGIGLGVRRLSIIDVEGGSQPISNEDGSIVVIQNGEIYNHAELRDELRRRGHQFRSRSDTEVLAHGYEEYGEELLGRLEGMFAIALFDRKLRRLLLARDRIGKKPLHYYLHEQEILFGSEIKAVLRYGVKVNIDDAAVKDYLYWGFIPAPRTIYKEIRKLLPGQCLVAEPGAIRLFSYDNWVPAQTGQVTGIDLRATLRDAVRRRLVADVEVATFLSGGIDSSIVTGLAQEVSPQPLRSFSIAFDEEPFNEGPFARRVAERFKTDHREFTCRYEPQTSFDDLLGYFDEPFADYSAIPTALLSRRTAQYVKVCLSGDGGDELFAGYPRYGLHLRYARYLRLLPAKQAARWLATLVALPFRDHNLIAWAATTPEERYLETSPFFLHASNQILETEFGRRTRDHDPRESARQILGRVEHLDLLAKLRYLDLTFYLPEDLMVKVDRMSMKWSLEVRCPFLDRRVVEAAFQIPSRDHLKGGLHKSALKDAFAGWLPDEVIRRPKMGFAPPVATWLRGSLYDHAEKLLTTPGARIHDYVRRDAIARMLAEHKAGTHDHHFKMWALIAFETWSRGEVGRMKCEG